MLIAIKFADIKILKIIIIKIKLDNQEAISTIAILLIHY